MTLQNSKDSRLKFVKNHVTIQDVVGCIKISYTF